MGDDIIDDYAPGGGWPLQPRHLQRSSKEAGSYGVAVYILSTEGVYRD